MKRMMMAALAAPLFLTACATPRVVSVEQPGDARMTCEEIEDAIREAQRFEEDARDERGVTGTNAAAFLFFWPGLVATYMNTDEAIDAARDRQEYLMDLYRDRDCE